ncbi:MAG: 30S ribosomal protein S4 [Patescibacteria group bacterium]
MPKADRVTIQCARCRRAGEKLFLKGDKCFTAKCPVARRGFPPGQHGPTQRVRLTSYGEQLKEKQKAKRVYGLRERQFSNYVAKASKRKGNTAEGLLKFLEKRLDNVVYRLGLAKSRESARQMVSHRHFLVNGKRVNIPSFQVEPDQIISIAEKSQPKKIFENLKQTLVKHELPVWLSLDAEKLSGKVLSEPKIEGLQFNFDPKKIIEFYSR